jgi:hypothetical protein
VSALVGVSWILEQMDGQIEAVTVAARMAACLGLVISRQTRMSGLTTTEDSAGNQRRNLRFEPGMIGEIGQGDSITQITPRHPSTNFADFLDTLGRISGLAFGLPLEVSMMNHTKSNYSQSRAALLQAQRVWRNYQRMMGRYKSRVFQWWILRKMELGEIPYRADALEHKWRMPGWRWVDPGKELEAGLGAVDAGICTRAELAKSQGRDLREIVKGLRAEEELFARYGLQPAMSRMTRDREPQDQPGEVELNRVDLAEKRPESFKPPAGVQKAAELGLRYREEYGRGGTAVGVARARDLSNGSPVSWETIKRMHSFFERHGAQGADQPPKAGEEPSAGYIAWLLWGGDPGQRWARKLRNRYTEAEREARELATEGADHGRDL